MVKIQRNIHCLRFFQGNLSLHTKQGECGSPYPAFKTFKKEEKTWCFEKNKIFQACPGFQTNR